MSIAKEEKEILRTLLSDPEILTDVLPRVLKSAISEAFNVECDAQAAFENEECAELAEQLGSPEIAAAIRGRGRRQSTEVAA